MSRPSVSRLFLVLYLMQLQIYVRNHQFIPEKLSFASVFLFVDVIEFFCRLGYSTITCSWSRVNSQGTSVVWYQVSYREEKKQKTNTIDRQR